MIVATFKVYDNQGKNPQIQHYFVDKYPGMLKKLCAVFGISKQFDEGCVDAETLKNRNVKVLVKIHEDETGQFGDKNVIAAFKADVPSAAPSNDVEAAMAASAPFDPEKPDGIPF